MSIQTLIASVKEQSFPISEYAVFGSALLGLYGLREVPNIDLIVTNKLWGKLIQEYTPNEEGFIRFSGVKISNWWFAVTRKDIPTMIKEAEIREGIPFVRIEEVRYYKEKLNREKDKRDIELIDQYLAQQQE